MTLAPDPLPNDVAALQAIIARQAKELDERATALSDAKTEIKARDLAIEQLQLTLDKLKRSQFGRSSEKIQRQIDQLELALEDLQTDQAADQAKDDNQADDHADGNDQPLKPKRRRGRKKLPAHLPRERSVLDPGDVCPDCGGELRLQSRPLATKFKTWLEVQLKRLPEKSDLTKAIRYGLSRWNAFTLFLEDAAVAIDNNAAERAMRPLCIGRKNWMFAGSDRGAENAATIMTIIETAKLSNINPQAYIADLFQRLPDHKINRLDELMPWNWKPSSAQEAKAA